MDVFLTGGSGYVGGYVIPRLCARGHRVFALARSARAAERVGGLAGKVQAVEGDLSAPGNWLETAARADAIIHLATRVATVPRRASRRFFGWAQFSAHWVELVREFESRALEQLLAAARRNPGCTLITTTGPAASGHHSHSDLVDEDALGATSSFGAVQRMIETRTLDAVRSGMPASVLRPGAVYEPDGGFAAQLLGAARRGRAFYAGRGDNYVSWVHIEDYAEAYVHAVERGAQGAVIAVVDDEPFTSRSAMEELARLCGAARPRSVPAWSTTPVGPPSRVARPLR